MIIQANSEEGQKTKIFLKDGSLCTLPIKSYDTETGLAVHYEFDEKGQIRMTDWAPKGKKMERTPILTTTVLEGSYAEIDGRRVGKAEDSGAW